MTIKHVFQSAKSDSSDATLVRPTNWNADHVIGDGTLQIDAAASIATFTLTAGGVVGLTLGGVSSTHYAHIFDFGSNVAPHVVFKNSGANVGPNSVLFHNPATAVANDTIGQYLFYGKDVSSPWGELAALEARLTSAAAGAPSCELFWYATTAGVESFQCGFGNGVIVGSPTGGYKGTGSLNVAVDVYVGGGTYLLRTTFGLTSSPGAGAGTLTNAPSAGNPTKWIAIDDNGTSRKIPAW